MKSFDIKENKRNIKKETKVYLLTLILFILGMMLIGVFCYLLSLFASLSLSGKIPVWEVYMKFFNFRERQIEELFAEFTIQFFAFFSLFSVLIYAGIFYLLKKIELIRNNYEDLREQIYDALTMLIFLFGFLPLMLKFSMENDYETIIKEIDITFLTFMIGLLPPYLYSSFSKIYYSIEEKQFSKSLINHMEKKINNNQ
ncbi:hypothetical protein [Lysinibacillus varians]|uniref:DUF2975 domain-containing protein n=1 Tax=Lysinibacillus varians TaxID=1145276 RepID=A0ABY2T4A6_9BACI|nr:hypothetical protein [Lysinibacillus varians]AHN24273.1 hypothetical protein T479_12715 [Lysinibacillus varians]TKI51334.1 hypothetical protein FC752_22095 [Lysinibacillus varians]